MSGPTRVLKADGLPSVVSKNRLITFFRNEHGQGGGPVDDVIMSEDGLSAVVIFKEPEAVERVLDRGHTVTMSNDVVRVSPVYDYDKFRVDSSSRPQTDSDNKINSPTAQLANPQFTNSLARIVALQAKQSISQAKLGYSQVKQNNSQDKLSNSQAKQNNSQTKQNNSQDKISSLNSPFLIIRQNSEPVINVCEKRELKGQTEHSYVTDTLKRIHMLATKCNNKANDNNTVKDLNVCDNTEDVITNLDDPVDILDSETIADDLQTHPNYLLLIGDLGDPEDLGPLLTGQTGVKVHDVIQQDKPDTCIVVFNSTLDISPRQWELTALGSKALLAGPVYKTNSIIVSGLTEAVSIATLVNYLEKKPASEKAKRKVKFLETINNDQQVIVYFEDDSGLTIDFLKQDHVIDNVRLYFSQYFPCLSKEYVYAKEFTADSKPSVGAREKVFRHQRVVKLEKPAFSELLQLQHFDQIRAQDKEVHLSFNLKFCKVRLKGNDESKVNKAHKNILSKYHSLNSSEA